MDAVYFDFDGTLVEFDRSFVAIVEDAMARLDAEVAECGVEAFGRTLGEQLETADDSGDVSRIGSLVALPDVL